MGKRIEDSMRALRLAAEMSQRFYEKPLIITYSGGKDSSVLLDLAENCLKPNEFEVIHSLTTVDAPETFYFIKDEFKRLKAKGVNIVNPIYDWTRKNVWEYIRSRHLKVNPLYDRGYTRVGCIGCPLASYWSRKKEFSEYPKYKEAYLRAFEKMLEERKRSGLSFKFKSAQEMFDCWMEEYKHNCKGQITLQEWETEISVKA